MKFAALAIVALAASGLAKIVESVDYNCQTISGTPMLHHVQWVIDNLAKAGAGGGECIQYAEAGHDCTRTISDYSDKGGGAALMMYKGSSKKISTE